MSTTGLSNSKQAAVSPTRAIATKLDLWQRGLKLLMVPFLPDSTHDFTNNAKTLEEWALYNSAEYRSLMLAETVRSAKLALDACLDGYYSQSLAMCRILFETWKRVAFVRRERIGVFRFLPQQGWVADEALRLGLGTFSFREPEKGDWDRVFPEGHSIETQEGVDRKFLEAANGHMRYLNSHAHPDLEAVTQLMQPTEDGFERYQLRIHPMFSVEHAERCAHLVCSAMSLLMFEVDGLLNMPPLWREEFVTWRSDFVTAFGKEPVDVFADNGPETF